LKVNVPRDLEIPGGSPAFLEEKTQKLWYILAAVV